ncbi:unnamed protein product [Victoria cruziana]
MVSLILLDSSNLLKRKEFSTLKLAALSGSAAETALVSLHLELQGLSMKGCCALARPGPFPYIQLKKRLSGADQDFSKVYVH